MADQAVQTDRAKTRSGLADTFRFAQHMRPKRLLSVIAVLALLYLIVPAYVLRFCINSVLFPATDAAKFNTDDVRRIADAGGNEILVRRYGRVEKGCVVFFPGQHGNIPSYEGQLFQNFTARGVAVFSLAYPGQDGAAGHARIAEVQVLATQALALISQTCPVDRMIFVGRSLGSMLAAYTARDYRPVGLVLDSAAPSLSAAIRTWLKSHWASRPLGELPISMLLRHDYSLSEALTLQPALRVVIFQGDSDTRTPISEFYDAKMMLPSGVTLVSVPGGTHADTYLRAGKAYFDAVFSMLE